MEARDGHQVIERAAAILRCLEAEPTGMTIAELTRASGLARTTVTRLVGSLRRESLVAMHEGRVRLGPALARLAHAANLDAAAIARPHMEGLSKELGETVDLWIERVDESELIAEVVSDQEVRICLTIGTRLPLHLTASGKALLAQRTDDELAAALPETLKKTTPKTLGHRGRLLEELAAVRETGIAIDDEEHSLGVCAVGAVLDLRLPHQYAIAVPMPASRFHEKQARATKALRACVQAIES